MDKISEKARKRDSQTGSIVKETARICGVSERYVRMVIVGERENREVLDCYMDLQEGFKEVIVTAENNKLLAAVKDLVPFN